MRHDATTVAARHRRSVRLPEYDYATAGAYIVTVCTQNRQSLFGQIIDGSMRLSEFGKIVESCRHALPAHSPLVDLDAFVIMPDHVHGIIMLHEFVGAGSPRPSLIQGAVTAPLHRHSLGQTVAYFKYQSTKTVNELQDTPGAHVWQRNYYEHVIRNDDELARAREYIMNNPRRRTLDRDQLQTQTIAAHDCAPAWLQRH